MIRNVRAAVAGLIAFALCAIVAAAPLSAFAADLTITAASVVPGSTATTATGTAGETITAGQVVYLSSTTNKYMKADCNSATAEARSPVGIALTGSSLNQPIVVLKAGDITIGATVTAGTAYYLSANAGGIAPLADLTTGDYPVIVGLAKSATVIGIKFQEAGVAL